MPSNLQALFALRFGFGATMDSLFLDLFFNLALIFVMLEAREELFKDLFSHNTTLGYFIANIFWQIKLNWRETWTEVK
jgi:hypothetical protein